MQKTTFDLCQVWKSKRMATWWKNCSFLTLDAFCELTHFTLRYDLTYFWSFVVFFVLIDRCGLEWRLDWSFVVFFVLIGRCDLEWRLDWSFVVFFVLIGRCDLEWRLDWSFVVFFVLIGRCSLEWRLDLVLLFVVIHYLELLSISLRLLVEPIELLLLSCCYTTYICTSG